MSSNTCIACILTPWSGAGNDGDPNHPLVADLYPIPYRKDSTNQPAAELQPDPNLYAIEAQLDKDTLDKINLDPRFYVLWSES
jgi:hypothetical protein